MKKTFAENNFERSRKRLSDAFSLLEKNIKEKIYETSLQSKMMEVSNLDNDESRLKVKIVEQAAIIDNLNSQVNNLQKELENIGLEVEFANEKNKMLINKLTELKSESNKIINEVEADLFKIEELIKEED